VTWGQRFARLVTDLVVRVPALWPLLRPALTRIFDRIAPQWDEATGPERMIAYEAALERVPGEPASALDLGTGTGDGAIAIARRWPGAEVLGVDVSAGMIAEARRKAPGLRFEVADARRLDTPDGAFDLVAMNNVIPFFGELGRIVAPGGHLLVAFSRGPATPIYVAPGRLRRGLERTGFELVEEVVAGPGTAIVARRLSAR
jgi:ubiquinone/menaquinone biosynthesis C-methylase UbiE